MLFNIFPHRSSYQDIPISGKRISREVSKLTTVCPALPPPFFETRIGRKFLLRRDAAIVTSRRSNCYVATQQDFRRDVAKFTS